MRGSKYKIASVRVCLLFFKSLYRFWGWLLALLIIDPPLYSASTFPIHRFASLVNKHGNLRPAPVSEISDKAEVHVLLHFDEKHVQLTTLKLRQTVAELKDMLSQKFDVHPGPYAIQMRRAALQQRFSLDKPHETLRQARLSDGDDVYFIKRSALTNYVHLYSDDMDDHHLQNKEE